LIRSRKLSKAGAAATLLAAAGAIAGCGFDDSLTARGFVTEGDRICGETIVAAAFDLESAGGLAADPEGGLDRLGVAYQDAGRRIAALDTHEDDDEFRQVMASELGEAGARLRGASTAGADDIEIEAANAFKQTGTFLDDLQQRGFRICGARLSQR